MTKLGFDPIWFGIIVVKMAEVVLLTPPVGLNCYVVGGVGPDIPLQAIYRNVWPFVLVDFACVSLFGDHTRSETQAKFRNYSV